MLTAEEIEDLVDYLDLLVYPGALVCHTVAVETAVAQKTLHSRFSRVTAMVLVCSRNVILSAPVNSLSNFFSAGKSLLDHGNLLPEGVHLYHLFEVIPEGFVILLHVFTVLGHAVETKLVALFLSEELLLH